MATRMDVNKWRVQRQNGLWVVFRPGWLWTPSFIGQDFGHCISALPYLVRIGDNTRTLRGRNER